MSKLRAAITFQHRVDEIKKIQQERMKENFAGPINSTDDSITLITDITKPIITIDDDVQPQETYQEKILLIFKKILY